ncbi:MAG: hypothetical protein ACYS6W_09720 [Planctomycetota bacterium]|jgi:hypothetical protein
MKSGTQRRWLMPAFTVRGGTCLFIIGCKFGSSEDALAKLQTGTDSGFLGIPVQT